MSSAVDPIETGFLILSACRQVAQGRTSLRRGFRLRRIKPERGWQRLYQRAQLLDEAGLPTLRVSDWLSEPANTQALVLYQAWCAIPQAHHKQQARWRILFERLPQQLALDRGDKTNLKALRALGLVNLLSPNLTPLGQSVVNHSAIPSKPRLHRWRWRPPFLEVPFPAHWPLVWQLENWLEPCAPGRYTITPASLQQAQAYGPLAQLAQVLTQGLQAPLPAELKKLLAEPCGAQVLAGPVLEFANVDEVWQLRQRPAWRRELDAHGQLLSPRHLHLSPHQAERLLRRLQPVLGLPPTPSPTAAPPLPSLGFSTAERAALYRSLITLEYLGRPSDWPPKLLGKLAAGLPGHLRQAAAQQGYQAALSLAPHAVQTTLNTNEELPSLVAAPVLWKRFNTLYSPVKPSRSRIMCLAGPLQNYAI